MEISDYKGHPLLVLRKGKDDKFPFQMGLTKAKLVLANLEDVRKFVAQEERNKSAAAPSGKSAPKPWAKARR